jgi:hypothetical protein
MNYAQEKVVPLYNPELVLWIGKSMTQLSILLFHLFYLRDLRSDIIALSSAQTPHKVIPHIFMFRTMA